MQHILGGVLERTSIILGWEINIWKLMTKQREEYLILDTERQMKTRTGTNLKDTRYKKFEFAEKKTLFPKTEI
jgi:hypothetical protein